MSIANIYVNAILASILLLVLIFLYQKGKEYMQKLAQTEIYKDAQNNMDKSKNQKD